MRAKDVSRWAVYANTVIPGSSLYLSTSGAGVLGQDTYDKLGGQTTFVCVAVGFWVLMVGISAVAIWKASSPRFSKPINQALKNLTKKHIQQGRTDGQLSADQYRVTVFRNKAKKNTDNKVRLCGVERVGRFSEDPCRVVFKSGEGVCGQAWAKKTTVTEFGKGDGRTHLPVNSKKEWCDETNFPKNQMQRLNGNFGHHLICVPVNWNQSVIAVLSLDVFVELDEDSLTGARKRIEKLSTSMVHLIAEHISE